MVTAMIRQIAPQFFTRDLPATLADDVGKASDMPRFVDLDGLGDVQAGISPVLDGYQVFEEGAKTAVDSGAAS